jgi:glycine cleavage system regulatory protein
VSESSSHSDLKAEGRLALYRLSTAIFDQHPTQLKDLSWDERPVDGQPGMLFSAQVHYRVDRLPSRYDTVTALVVQLDDGSLIIAASSVPNDANADVALQARDALRTLTIR